MIIRAKKNTWELERESVCVPACIREPQKESEFVGASMHKSVRVCVCVWERERERERENARKAAYCVARPQPFFPFGFFHNLLRGKLPLFLALSLFRTKLSLSLSHSQTHSLSIGHSTPRKIPNIVKCPNAKNIPIKNLSNLTNEHYMELCNLSLSARTI